MNSAGAAVIALAAFVALSSHGCSASSGCFEICEFTVVRKEKEIVISRGLIESNKSRFRSSGFKRLNQGEPDQAAFGLAAVTIVSAGGNVLEEDKSAILFPIISKK
ncbi:hypothetical protein PO124_26135 [Bacillus licheniformis]|nr:hypothetical protein [Bacillus licheniformis]